jgi:regulatory protein
MKTLISLKKSKTGFIADFGDLIITLDPDIVYRYQLISGLELEDMRFHEILEAQGYLSFYKKAIYKLKKMMTQHEMETYLEKEGAKPAWIKQIIFTLLDKKYLDDQHYAVTFAELKKYNAGPDMIRHQLKEKGVSLAQIESALSKYEFIEILDQLIEKKIQTMKSKPKSQVLKSLKAYYVQKGYSIESVDHALSKLNHLYQGNEEVLIHKDLEKLKKKYREKLEGYELNETLKQKLYAKGYAYDLIKKVIS